MPEQLFLRIEHVLFIPGIRRVRPGESGTDQLDGFEAGDDSKPTTNLVYQDSEMLDREPDEQFIEAASEEIARLIKFYHPKIVEEVP